MTGSITGTLTNRLTGKTVRVHVTNKHPKAHGKSVWVDDDGNAYVFVGKEAKHPIYEVEIDEPFKTRLAICRKLAKIRQEKGISIRALSKMIGHNISNISRLERGMNSPSIDSVVTIAGALGWKITLTSDLLIDDDDEI